MKKLKVFNSLMLIIILILLFLYCKNNNIFISNYENIINEEHSFNNEQGIDSSIFLSEDDIRNSIQNIDNNKNINHKDSITSLDDLEVDVSALSTEDDIGKTIQDINDRVLWINENLENLVCKDFDGYDDYYNENQLVLRKIFYKFSDEPYSPYAWYELYYNEFEKVIYADIFHYRAAVYDMYFHNSLLLYTEVGPFKTGGTFVNGDINQIEEAISKEEFFIFVLQDIEICLEYAYK